VSILPAEATQEYRLRLPDRECTVLHGGAVLSWTDEWRYLGDEKVKHHYGMALWPAAVALAHDISARAAEFRGHTVLELGAGTGLPGIVAAMNGARVVQTDKDAEALELCRQNGLRNGKLDIEYRIGDWSSWTDDARYDWVIAADVLYRTTMQDKLLAIMDRNVAAGGRALISDPMRHVSLPFLFDMDERGWRVRMNQWSVGVNDGSDDPRPIAVYELSRPLGV
jgi:predicted nicotinamide N-methyase